MTTVSHNINFSQVCETGGSSDSGGVADADFESTLEIALNSPPQQVSPCPDTILNYNSNISGGITATAKYGSASVSSVVTDEFTKSWAITSVGESSVPFQYQSIAITDWQPLLFNGEACGSSGAGHGAVSIADGIVTATSPGVITVKAVVTVFVITVTLEPPVDPVGTWSELVVVCQSGRATALEFEYGDCLARSIITPCCQRLDKQAPFVTGPDSMGATSSAGISVGGGCPPYSWAVSGSATLAGNNKKQNPDGTTSHDENDNSNIVETNDACTAISISVTDGCGRSATKEIEIDGCCSSFALSRDCSNYYCGGFMGMRRGETRAMRLLTSGEGQTVVWVYGEDKASVGTASPDYKGRVYYVTADGDCDGPFRFGVIDNCNPGSVLYFDGSLVDSGPCCPPDEPTQWDYANSAETIVRDGSAGVSVKGSLEDRSDFKWTVSGAGFTFSNGLTEATGGSSQVIRADATSCGPANITCEDACGTIVSGVLRNTDSGYWFHIGGDSGHNGYAVQGSYSGPYGSTCSPSELVQGEYRVENLIHDTAGWWADCSLCGNQGNDMDVYVANMQKFAGLFDCYLGLHSSSSCDGDSEPCTHCDGVGYLCHGVRVSDEYIWKCNP